MYELNSGLENQISLGGGVEENQFVVLRQEVETLIENAGDRVTLNLGKLQTFNSQVLSLCLCCMRKASACGKQLEFADTPDRLFDMARVGGVEFIFSV